MNSGIGAGNGSGIRQHIVRDARDATRVARDRDAVLVGGSGRIVRDFVELGQALLRSEMGKIAIMVCVRILSGSAHGMFPFL